MIKFSINFINKFLYTQAFNETDVSVLKKDGIIQTPGTRRIVELDTFGKELFCRNCNLALSICDQIKEVKYGLASIFTVPCKSCGETFQVHTDKRRSDDADKTFVVNTKLALGNNTYFISM